MRFSWGDSSQLFFFLRGKITYGTSRVVKHLLVKTWQGRSLSIFFSIGEHRGRVQNDLGGRCSVHECCFVRGGEVGEVVVRLDVETFMKLVTSFCHGPVMVTQSLPKIGASGPTESKSCDLWSAISVTTRSTAHRNEEISWSSRSAKMFFLLQPQKHTILVCQGHHSSNYCHNQKYHQYKYIL